MLFCHFRRTKRATLTFSSCSSFILLRRVRSYSVLSAFVIFAPRAARAALSCVFALPSCFLEVFHNIQLPVLLSSPFVLLSIQKWLVLAFLVSCHWSFHTLSVASGRSPSRPDDDWLSPSRLRSCSSILKTVALVVPFPDRVSFD